MLTYMHLYLYQVPGISFPVMNVSTGPTLYINPSPKIKAIRLISNMQPEKLELK